MNRIFFVISLSFFGLMNLNSINASAPVDSERLKEAFYHYYDLLNDETSYDELLDSYDQSKLIEHMYMDLAREKVAMALVYRDNFQQIQKYTDLLYRDKQKTKSWTDLYKTIACCGLNCFFRNKVLQPNSSVYKSSNQLQSSSMVKNKAIDAFLHGEESDELRRRYERINKFYSRNSNSSTDNIAEIKQQVLNKHKELQGAARLGLKDKQLFEAEIKKKNKWAGRAACTVIAVTLLTGAGYVYARSQK